MASRAAFNLSTAVRASPGRDRSTPAARNSSALHQFDWITAFSIGFDRDRATNSRWGSREWDYLLRDLQSRLVPGGKIYLTLNPLPTGKYLTAELRDFFARRGADIERERVFFKRGLRG